MSAKCTKQLVDILLNLPITTQIPSAIQHSLCQSILSSTISNAQPNPP